MYIRMLNFQTNGNKKEEAMEIMNELIPEIKTQKGCKECLFVMHESDDHYALLVFWETAEDAANAAPIIGPRMIPVLTRISKEMITPRLYKVFEREAVVI